MANDDLLKYKPLANAQENNDEHNCKKLKTDKDFCKLYTPTLICLIFLLFIYLYVKFTYNWRETFDFYPLELNDSLNPNQCRMQLVESIPEGLDYGPDKPKHMSTFDAWSILLNLTNSNLNIGSFYWTMRGEDVVKHPSAAKGEEIYARLLANAVNGSAKHQIRIARSLPSDKSEELDTIELVRQGAADVRIVDFPRLVGGGVLHTKVWIVDNTHFYVGSANMDWRALTQVKELGVLATNCADLAQDLNKIFNAYWYLGTNSSTIPATWPKEYSTKINARNPLLVQYNEQFNMWTYFASSPPPLTPYGRTNDLEAILNTIYTAKHFVHVAVMDYYPLQIYTKPIKYWPYIDDALRAAAIERGVSIKLLISWWKHSSPSEDYFLRSLVSLKDSLRHADIQVKRFVVPSNADQKRIPFGRVNHNKYMVTDNTAYIGTSNWSGDYFIDTAGIGLVLRDTKPKENQSQSTLRLDLQNVFQRDWDSIYATSI